MTPGTTGEAQVPNGDGANNRLLRACCTHCVYVCCLIRRSSRQAVRADPISRLVSGSTESCDIKLSVPVRSYR
jgi:hypothetical protein